MQDEWVFPPKKENTTVTLATGKKETKEIDVCSTTIAVTSLAQEMFLVGSRFMRRYYTVFDRDQERIGLALSTVESEYQKRKE